MDGATERMDTLSVEYGIAQVWKHLFQLEQVGRTDNFFELGGDSTLVLDALARVNQQFGCELTVADAYLNPTIEELALCVCGGETKDELVDLLQEAALDDALVALPGQSRSPAENVLLTGATGFVGRFLLAQLLRDTDSTIYCLVRAPNQSSASSRLRERLSSWDLWRDELLGRVVAIPGDLRMPRLGIEETTYRQLSRSIDSVHHCATSMNHLETYAMAKPANVGAIREVLRLASDQNPKVINYISTLGVFNGPAPGSARVVDEDTPIDYERHWASEGYTASKWVGEKMFLAAQEKGIACNIFRLGLICADSERGRYDRHQYDYRLLKSCLLSGYGIRNYRFRMVPTPVDYAARAVVLLSNRHPDGRGIFHISSCSEIPERVFERYNEAANAALDLLPFYEWVQEIKRLHYLGRPLPIAPLMESEFCLDEVSFYDRQRMLQSQAPLIDCTRTQRELEGAGVIAHVFNNELMRLSLDDMRARDVDLSG